MIKRTNQCSSWSPFIFRTSVPCIRFYGRPCCILRWLLSHHRSTGLHSAFPQSASAHAGKRLPDPDPGNIWFRSQSPRKPLPSSPKCRYNLRRPPRWSVRLNPSDGSKAKSLASTSFSVRKITGYFPIYFSHSSFSPDMSSPPNSFESQP